MLIFLSTTMFPLYCKIKYFVFCLNCFCHLISHLMLRMQCQVNQMQLGKICFFFKEVVQGFGYQMFFNDCNYVNTKLQCYRFQKSALDFILIILVLPQMCSCLHASVNYTRSQGVPYVIFFYS